MTTPIHCIAPKKAETLQNTLPKTVKRDFTSIYQRIRALDHARTTGVAESYILVGLNLTKVKKIKKLYFSNLIPSK